MALIKIHCGSRTHYSVDICIVEIPALYARGVTVYQKKLLHCNDDNNDYLNRIPKIL